MPSCVFRRCTNYTANVKDKNVSFHALPKDELMKEKWICVIRAQRQEYDWLPTPYCKVCSNHFLASDLYITDKKYQRIKKTAVPVLSHKTENITSSPTSLDDVELSDEESIFETRTIAILKKRLRKISIDKQKLLLKTYNLNRINKRLKEKCKNLQRLLSELQKEKVCTVEVEYI